MMGGANPEHLATTCETVAPSTTSPTHRLTLPVACVALGIAAFALWLQDLHWTESWADAAPALAALPLAWWLGRPWTIRDEGNPAAPFRASVIASAGVLYLLGNLSGTLLLSVAGWIMALSETMRVFLDDSSDVRSNAEEPGQPALISHWSRLLPLAALGFPWLAFESPWIGVSFRHSAAASTEWLLTAMQLDVARQGTALWTNGLCVSVGEACSGLKGLQALLIAGSVVAVQTLGRSNWFWWHLPLLMAGAWAANTARVVWTALGVHWLPRAWVDGEAHLWQGWALLCVAFFACQWTMQHMADRDDSNDSDESNEAFERAVATKPDSGSQTMERVRVES